MGASLRQRRADEKQEAPHNDDSDSLVISDIDSDLDEEHDGSLHQSIHTQKEPLEKKLTLLSPQRWFGGGNDHRSEKSRESRAVSIEFIKPKQRASLLQYIKARRRATAQPNADLGRGGNGGRQTEQNQPQPLDRESAEAQVSHQLRHLVSS